MKVTKFEPTRGININHRKEQHFQDETTGFVFHDGEFRKIITLRTYGTGGRNYACVWIFAGTGDANGSGQAGGCGYHRPSAAAHFALEKAGVKLSEPIDGRGDSAIEEAVRAVVRYFYPRNKHILIHRAHP
ncbi:MAG: hypothetical protein ACOC90_05435 [Bacteroidota bacterium]